MNAPKSFEEAQQLKERLRNEKSSFIEGLDADGIAALESIHRAKGKKNPKVSSFQRYEGFDRR